MATQVALPLGANPDGGPRVLVSSILREFKAAAVIELGDDGVAHDVCHVVVPITPRFMDVTLPVVGRFFPGRRTALWLSLGLQDTHALTMDLDDCSVGEQDIALTNADSLGTIPAPAVIDLNNDGYDDLMASGAVEDALMSNPLTGSFVAVNTATGLFRFADLGILPLAVLDVDGDGHVDLADYLGAYLWRKR